VKLRLPTIEKHPDQSFVAGLLLNSLKKLLDTAWVGER